MSTKRPGFLSGDGVHRWDHRQQLSQDGQRKRRGGGFARSDGVGAFASQPAPDWPRRTQRGSSTATSSSRQHSSIPAQRSDEGAVHSGKWRSWPTSDLSRSGNPRSGVGDAIGDLSGHAGIHVSRAGRTIRRRAARPRTYSSISATLYALLAGSLPPFIADTLFSILKATIDAPHPPIRTLRGEISERTALLLDKCLEKFPGHRDADAAALWPRCGRAERRWRRIRKIGSRDGERTGRDRD